MRSHRASLAIAAAVASLGTAAWAADIWTQPAFSGLQGKQPSSIKRSYSRSKYTRHQGAKECARRRRQMGIES